MNKKRICLILSITLFLAMFFVNIVLVPTTNATWTSPSTYDTGGKGRQS